MRNIQLIILLAVLIVSCSSQSGTEPKSGIYINELAFEKNNNNKLFCVEIFNNTADSLDINKMVLVVNGEDIPLNSDRFLKEESFGFFKVKAKFKNKNFKLQLKVKGKVVDELNWKSRKKSEFIGRIPNGGNLYRLESRSLGQTNNWTSIKISKPKFNIKTGVYADKQEVELKAEYDDIPLYYTLDGSAVNKNSKLYDDPITVATNTIIKAKYIGESVKSKTKILSVFIGEKTKFPIVSIVLDSTEFWGEEIGLLEKGPGAEMKFPYKGANYWKDIKLKANFQVLNSKKKEVLNEKAGVKIHGNYSRIQSLKGLRIKSEKKNFKFKPFQNKKLKSFPEITLRGAGQDMGQGHFRDAFAHNYFGSRLNLDVQAAAPVVVFVNAKYYGLMYFREVYNSKYFDQHYGCTENVNMLKLWGVPMWGAKSDGGYQKLKKLLERNQSDEAVASYDFDNWMDYYIVETYSGNKDWFPNNAKFWKSSSTGKWRYVLNDLDAGFGRTSADHYQYNSFKFLKEKSPNLEFKVFMKNERLKQQFLLRYMDLLNTILNADTISKHALIHKKSIEPEMPRLFEHHTYKRSLKKWNEVEIPKLFEFYEKRENIIRKQLQQEFSQEVPFSIKIDATGKYTLNTIECDGGIKGFYFPSQTIKVTSTDKDFAYFLLNGKKVASKTISITGKTKENISLKVVLK